MEIVSDYRPQSQGSPVLLLSLEKSDGKTPFWKWGIDWLRKLLHPKDAVLDIPKKTLIVLPGIGHGHNRWHQGSISDKPAMQIAGQLRVTNITTYNIHPTVKLKEPTSISMITIFIGYRNTREDIIPAKTTVDLMFNCFIEIPTKKAGETFVSNVAVVDQFGNEHWIKKISFQYS